MNISSFDWDHGNLEKLKKHKVLQISIEDFFINHEFYIFDDQEHSFLESRYIAFGQYQDRHLFIVFTFRAKTGALQVRVISARFAHKKEAELIYEKIKNKKESNN